MNISEKLLPPSCALKMEEADFSKMFVPNHQTTYMVPHHRKQWSWKCWPFSITTRKLLHNYPNSNKWYML